MGYAASRGTHRILLKDFDGSDEYVDIKAGRTYGESTRVLQAGANITGMSTSGQPTFDSVDIARAQSTLFQQSIVAWSLKGDAADAEPLPLTHETFVNVLDADVAAWLGQAIATYYQNRRLNEQRLGESNASSTGP